LKKALLLFTVGALLVSVLCGCGGGVDKRLYGYWADGSGEYQYGFGTDGKGYTVFAGFTMPVTYTMEKDIIYIIFSEEGDPKTDDNAMICKLSFFGDNEFKMEYPLDSGNIETYKRQSSPGAQQ